MTLDTPSLTTSPRGAGVPSSSSSIPSATPLGTWGLVNSMGIFQAYWQEHQLTSYSSKAIGWIASLNVFLNLFLGVQIGPLFDRYGPHWILAVGSNGYVLALFLMAQCSQYWRFMLCYGVLACVSSSMLSTTSVSVIAHWFDTKRGQASGIVFIGSSLGGVVIPLAMQPMLRKLGWAWSIHIVAFIILFLSLVGNLCIRGPLPKKQRGGTIDLKCFRDFRFIWATIGIASFEFILVGSYGLLPIYALYAGFSSQTSFNILAVLNAGSIFGRYLAGRLADRHGRFNVMALTLILSFVLILALWLPITHRRPALLYAFAALFGFSSGSVISLAPVCYGQLCRPSQYGQYYGTGYSVVSFATLVCIPAGAAVLSAGGTQALIAFFAAMLVLSFLTINMARWATLEYKWRWTATI